jgi:predicted DNA-binding protein (MmcQ/YjbR family)
MDYSEKLSSRRPLESSLLSFGFHHADSFFVLEKPSAQDPSFFFRVSLGQDSLRLDLIETASGEIYAPFSIEGAHGSFVASFREEGDALIDDILAHCFESDSLREQVIAYVKNHFGAEITYAWPERFPHYCTIHDKNNPKWFGILMNVPFEKLGIKKKGEVQILDLKANPEEIQKMIDHQTYFPAYHMSKKDWITILLSRSTPFEDIAKLLEESHALSQKKK